VTSKYGPALGLSRKPKLDAGSAAAFGGWVSVAKDQQREVVRLLYVATRRQVKALAAVPELEGLE
jgi:hypothetical protein